MAMVGAALALGGRGPAGAAQSPPGSPIVLFWELPPKETDGVASGITGTQGWTFSTAGAIEKVELFVDGVSEGPMPCCSPRKDVMDQIEGAPLATGFNGVTSWGRFAPGVHTMELVVTDSAGNELRETRQVRTVKVLPQTGFARSLSLMDATCSVSGPAEISCTGVRFQQGACGGSLVFRWLDGKQGLEVVRGCGQSEPLPTPTPTAVAVTPTPGGTGSQTIADCGNPALCPVGCITEPILNGFGLFNIVIFEGERRTFCAPVLPPYVGFHPEEIQFEFYDQSDLSCGLLDVEVEQTTGAMQTLDSGGALPNGNILFRRRFGPMDFPERTEPGIYRIHLTGGGGCATNWRLAWTAR